MRFKDENRFSFCFLSSRCGTLPIKRLLLPVLLTERSRGDLHNKGELANLQSGVAVASNIQMRDLWRPEDMLKVHHNILCIRG